MIGVWTRGCQPLALEMVSGTMPRVALRPRRMGTFRLHDNISMRKLHELFVFVHLYHFCQLLTHHAASL
jgi:hypothetical protein